MSATIRFAPQSAQSVPGPLQSTANATAISKPALWAGRIISGLIVLFMLFDAITKLMKVSQVLEATVRLGVPVSALSVIGVILLICTIIYAIPRTSILGAVLLTGYLGGAVATQLRAGGPAFETVFPVLFGALVWLGVYLRDLRLRALVPF
jgi:hypothetical protein